MWQLLKGLPGAVKVWAGIVSGLITGIVTAFALLTGPIRAEVAKNMDATLVNTERIVSVQVSQRVDAARIDQMAAKVDKILCNLDPRETWNTCELKYNGIH